MKGAIGIALLALGAVAAARPQLEFGDPKDTAEWTPEENQSNPFANIIANTQALISNLFALANGQSNPSNTESGVNTYSINFANIIQSVIAEMCKNLKNNGSGMTAVWGNVNGRLNKVVDDINRQNPNAVESLADLQAAFNEGVNRFNSESVNALEDSPTERANMVRSRNQAVGVAVQAMQNLKNLLQQSRSTHNAARGFRF